MTWYLTIRADSQYSQFVETARVIEYLATIPELHQTSPVAFESIRGQPWVALTLALSGSTGNYSSDGNCIPQINVIELSCSDFGNPIWYELLAGRIASFLGWFAFEDHEQRQIWPKTT